MKLERKNKNEFRVEVPKFFSQTVDYASMVEWCTKMFGDDGRKRKYRWRYGWLHPKVYSTTDQDVEFVYYFYFRREKDAAYFILNWAG